MTTEVLHSGSHVLHGSESLCKMLQYLTHQALSNPGVSVKEYQIATEVFGRPSDFDPHLDATVRVRAGRLRSKLAEYYGGVGHDDRICGGVAQRQLRTFLPSAPGGKSARATTGPHAVLDEFTKPPSARKLVFVIVVLCVLLALDTLNG